MKIDSKILQEIQRYKKINNYILEQDATLPPPPAGDAPPAAPADPAAAGAPPADPAAAAPVAPPTPTGPQPVDLETDKEVEKLDDKGDKKEVEVTDLVKSQKDIQTKQEEYFENLFSQLSNLESKLSHMDELMSKLDSLEAKVEKYRIKSPEEKMELRTLDSGPYNQKLSDFFQDKEADFEKSGKEQYVLTKDEVEDFSPNDIKKSSET